LGRRFGCPFAPGNKVELRAAFDRAFPFLGVTKKIIDRFEQE
jgi:hypothetical protein